MKTQQLALNDIVTIANSCEVLFESYHSNDSLAILLGVDIDSIPDNGSFIKATIPKGTRLKVYDFSSMGDSRETWSIKFVVLEWPPVLINDILYLVIPIDELNKIEFSKIETYPEPIEFEMQQEDETKEKDDLDFSHIK